MAKRLTENVNSRYIEAANRLRPNKARKRVVVYVESYDDVSFWRSALDEFENDRLYFEIMLPSRTNLAKGKRNVLNNELGKNLGACMIACVDADYDYLLQGKSPLSEEMLSNPYVFHTYVYAIENYQCYARGLHEACVMATMNDKEVIDFEAFMAEYSRIIFPLLVWSVWVYRYGCYSRFTLNDFAGIVSVNNVNPYHPENMLAQLRRIVNRKIAWLQQHYPQGKTTYKPLQQEMLNLGVTPETAYLYMQGHALMENVVLPLLTPVCTQLRKERESEIRRNAVHEKQRQNELSCYQHRQTPIDLMLRKSTKYLFSEPYQKLREDLSEFVQQL